MKYIKKIILKNFQSHKHTEIELDERLNVIVGSSNSGKTSILRAIKWVLYNEPTGDFFIREGETEASVSLVFSDGKRVERYRSPSKNQYRIYPANGGEAEIYQGFGLSVPLEVEEATGIKKIMLDSKLANPINLAEQLEGAFLLSESDSVKASSIGRLIGVNIIDDALRESLLDLRQLNNRRKDLECAKGKLEEEYKEYEYLDEYEKKLNILRSLREDIGDKSKAIKNLEVITESLDFISGEKEKYELVETKLSSIKDLEINILTLDSKLRSFDKLLILDRNYKFLLDRKKDELSKKELLSDIDRIDLDSLNKKIDRLNKLSKLTYAYNKNKKELEVSRSDLLKLERLDKIDYEEININIEAHNKLRKIFLIRDDIGKRLDFGRKYLERFENIEISQEASLALVKKLELISKLNIIGRDYSRIKAQKAGLEKEILKLKKEYEEAIGSYRSILEKQEVCPYCFSRIDSEHLDKLIEKYYEE